MSAALDELLQRASALPREERVQLVKLLADDLAQDASSNGVGRWRSRRSGRPDESHDAAAVLMSVLHGAPTE